MSPSIEQLATNVLQFYIMASSNLFYDPIYRILSSVNAQNFNKLEYLDVSGAQFREFPTFLYKLHKLEFVNLHNTTEFEKTFLLTLFNNTPVLKTLLLGWNKLGNMTFSDVNTTLFHGLLKLETLDMAFRSITRLSFFCIF